MIKKHCINKLIIGFIFISVGYLFFANISWLSLNFINKHEMDFHVLSHRLIKYFLSLNFKDFFTVVFSQGQHPPLPILLFAFFRFFLSPLIFNEFFTIKMFYFFSYLISLIYVYRLALLYTPQRKILSGIIAILYALSTSFYYQTLFEGQAPEDLVANTFLFLCLYSYVFYRKALDEKDLNKVRQNAVFLSLLVACCFFSKYNVGVFIALSIIIDLFCACYVFKTYSIKELRISYVILPFFALLAAWFSSAFIRNQYFTYISVRLARENKIDVFYYLKLLFVQNKPFLHSIEGIWKHKADIDMSYFYHWGEGVIALICLLVAYKSLVKSYKIKKISNEQKFTLLPLIYVAVNLLFFSSSNYRHSTALISTIPVMWLIVGSQIAEFSYFCNNAENRRNFLREIIRSFVVILIVGYLFICSFLQYFRLNNQIVCFMNRNNTKQLSEDSEEAIAQIKKFAFNNNCVVFTSIQPESSFFEEYFSKLLSYRLLSESSHLKHVNNEDIQSLFLRDKENALFIEIMRSSVDNLFSDYSLSEFGNFKSSAIKLSFRNEAYNVNIYSLSYSQLKFVKKLFK